MEIPYSQGLVKQLIQQENLSGSGQAACISLRVGCEFRYQVTSPAPAIVQVQARRDGTHQVLHEDWKTTPPIGSHEYADVYGNLQRRLTLPVGNVRFSYDALVEVCADADEIDLEARQLPVEELPDDTLMFTLASRYCQSDILADVAWKLFGATEPGWARVQAICDWTHQNILYKTGSSTPDTTALDVYNQRAGICRDFAHIGVTFCRALNIPARYVFGYLPDIAVPPPDTPMDFHAWFEAFLDGRWRTFDARHNIPRIGRVPIARGRDAIDCAMVTTYGAATLLEMIVWADAVDAEKRGAGLAGS
jgi:transglutaminase-like putative cysteine protease